MQEKGLFRGKADNKMVLPQCSRSKDIIEPMLKPQWWVDCSGMAAAAAGAARSGDLEILPAQYEATWYRWLDNIRDWCISRQLWWGHRVPAWYVARRGEAEADAGVPGAPSERSDRWVVARDEAEARAAAAEKCAPLPPVPNAIFPSSSHKHPAPPAGSPARRWSCGRTRTC